MIVDVAHGPVGSWDFQDESAIFATMDRRTLRELVRRCQIAAVTLEQHRLLRCTTICFSPSGLAMSTLGWKSDFEYELGPSSSACDLLDECERAVDQIESRLGFSYPSTVQIFGNGIVVDGRGREEILPNLIWIWAMTAGFHLVEINTQSDVWMPYTIDAKPQHELCAANSPRLEAALRDVEARLATEIHPQGTNFALCEKYVLRNIPSGDGVLDCSFLLNEDSG